MSKYLLIESRDLYESGDVGHYFDLAEGLARGGNDVTLFLVQNGVLPARRGARSDGLDAAIKVGIEILADDFSLRERAISASDLRAGVKSSPLDAVVDGLADGAKTIWH
jgi:predicted peroxiredoxin